LYRQLDPATAFVDPALRHILGAIDLAWRELGCADFASLIQVLRELGQLEDCGGTEGVSQVLGEYRYGFNCPLDQRIFLHEVQMLKAYALGRANDPPVLVWHFNRGDLQLTRNKFKSAFSTQPDYQGSGKVAGRSYHASCWTRLNNNNQEVLNISLIPT
jgi:hypothetical protein